MRNGIGIKILIFGLGSLLLVSCKSPQEPDIPLSKIPVLISPQDGAVLDNGRTDRKDYTIWDFDWTDVKSVWTYHIYVEHVGSRFPLIDEEVSPFSSGSEYHYKRYGGYIADKNRFDWRWRVRTGNQAFTDTSTTYIVWNDWSEWKYFDVEPVNTDPPVDESTGGLR